MDPRWQNHASQGDGLAGAAAQVVEGVKTAAAAGVEKAKEAADVAKAHLIPLPEEGTTPVRHAALQHAWEDTLPGVG